MGEDRGQGRPGGWDRSRGRGRVAGLPAAVEAGREGGLSFLVGAAISAHQTEGGNVNSDWWWWEHQPSTPCREPSGDACDFYNRYRSDIEMLAGFGLNAFRFSIEWARIEPAEGEFSDAQLAHYGRVLDACLELGVAPLVTFHHFTIPLWLHQLGGFTHDRFPALFERYCRRAAAALGDRMAYACTINEPQGLGLSGWVAGVNPRGRRDDHAGAERAVDNLLHAHELGAAAIRHAAGVPVGVTLAMPDLQYEDGAQPGSHPLEVESRVIDRFLALARGDDFVGVQTYTRYRFGPEGLLEPEGETTLMGYEFYPQALDAAIRRAHAACPEVPILVTESGIATADDDRRVAYIEAAVEGVQACLDDGIDIGAYLYWSLLDNFEWALGYEPTFGLVAVDRTTQVRTPRPSAYRLGRIAKDRFSGSPR